MSTHPDFIIIGAMKCGTTSLHYYLRSHPDIYMPLEKELDYFIRENNFGKGLDWYLSKFDASYMLNGEASPNYTKAHLFSGVAERIYDMLPKAKLIFLYRDPVERAYSHYVHNLAIGAEKASPEKAITEDSKYIKTSKYFWQIQQFLNYYNEDQILLVDAEELRNNRKQVMKKIYSFLGVKFFYEETIFEKDRHQSKVKTKRSWFNSMLLKTGIGSYLKKVAPEEVKNFYKKTTEKELDPPELSEDLKKNLKALLAEDFKQFQHLEKSLKELR